MGNHRAREGLDKRPSLDLLLKIARVLEAHGYRMPADREAGEGATAAFLLQVEQLALAFEGRIDVDSAPEPPLIGMEAYDRMGAVPSQAERDLAGHISGAIDTADDLGQYIAKVQGRMR